MQPQACIMRPAAIFLNDVFTTKITQYFTKICNPLTPISPRVAREPHRSNRVALCHKCLETPGLNKFYRQKN